MHNEKIIELSVPILCALIERGFVPPTMGATEATLRALIAETLDTVSQAVKMAHEELERKDRESGSGNRPPVF